MLDAITNFLGQTGFAMFGGDNWKCLIMIVIAFVLAYLAIVKQYEPLLLLPIAFGMLLTNLPGAEMFHEELFAGGHVNWAMFSGADFINSANLAMPDYFSILKSGEVIMSDGYGSYVFGQLSGLTLETEALINSAGQIVTASGEIIKENANILIDLVGLSVQNGNLYINETLLGTGVETITAGLLDYLYLGVKLGIYPCLIFLGVGAMTDFGPLIANPKSLQVGS